MSRSANARSALRLTPKILDRTNFENSRQNSLDNRLTRFAKRNLSERDKRRFDSFYMYTWRNKRYLCRTLCLLVGYWPNIKEAKCRLMKSKERKSSLLQTKSTRCGSTELKNC